MNIAKRDIHPQEQAVRAAMDRAQRQTVSILPDIPGKKQIAEHASPDAGYLDFV
jgi:hypothetical protein